MVRLKTDDKRAAILKATLRLVNSNGFHAAPMAKIASEIGISAGTIYLYFQNKEDLINTLYRELKTRFATKALQGFSPDMPVKKGFETIWRNILQYKISEPEEAVFIEQCDNTPMVTDVSREVGLKSVQPLFDLWEQGQREGIIKPVCRQTLFAFSLFPIIYLANIYTKASKELSAETIDAAFGASWDAIRM
ncbi:MAG TPA: TetR/AcrR family transcriptional regulator [Prolixibacteraceae bacterium]|nr:TetR/AcrR family transcriptional regulator [Prolixibacteraceae bacterium]